MADIGISLNFHHLRYFAAIVETGSLSAAARSLRISHPTLSEQLKRLEEQLDMRLFERVGKRLLLNENGRMVYDFAEQIFGIGDALVEAVERRRGGALRLMRVGIDSVLPKLVVRQILADLVDKNASEVRLRCTESDRERLVGQLRTRQLDLVLSDEPAGAFAGEVRSLRVAASPVSLFCTSKLARRYGRDLPSSLSGAPFLLPLPTTRMRRELERWMGDQQVHPHIAGEIEDSGLIKALGEHGRGLFAMPTEVADEVTQQYRVRELMQLDSVEAHVFAIIRDSASEGFLRRLQALAA